MYCPKCGQENSDDARVCNSCGCELTQVSAIAKGVNVRISKAAIASFVCALFALGFFVPGLVSALDPRALSPESDVVHIVACVSFLTGCIAVILGVISIVEIEQSGGKVTGRIFAVAAVLIPVFAGLSLVLIISYTPRRSFAYRMVCGTNLSRIGKAMYHYANDYDNEFPRAGGPNTEWGMTANWQADNRYNAYGLSQDGSGGRATVSSSFYLLVKYMEVKPKSFLCKGDAGISVFNPSKDGVKNKDLIDLWDFGPEPTKHCSYSYHMPYGPYALTTSYLPGVAVAADRNPWMASPFVKAKRNFNKFNPDGGREKSNIGNAVAHQENGQNVLFMDSHVSFERHSFCGINDDNIYTYWDGPDIRRGAIPNLKSQPIGRLDSMLVNDLP